ncbi:MAG TPA: Gfo/Idh/MocA family oxidoreductase [archaeon]|nr:Gfo/Idh/MocA family oxidoreductase [archaeon]
MADQKQKIRLGIIGCGIIASEAHVPALERLTDRFAVTALCNRTRPKAEALARRLGLGAGSIWQDWERMLEEARVDAVLICLPIELNYPVSQSAAASGRHVLCEKPIGQSNEEARAAAGLSGRYGVTYMVAEDCHYMPSYAKAAELVKQGAVGRPVVMSWNMLRFMDTADKYARTLWRINHVYPGGYVLDGGVHFVHVLQMMAGKVVSVKAETLSIEPLLGKVDTAFALLRHESGVLTSLNMSWHTRDQSDSMLRIFGTGGSLLAGSDKIIRVTAEGKTEEVPFQNEDDYYIQLIDFHRAVTTGEPPAVSAEMAAHDVAVILAILESAERNRPVMI